MCKGSNLIGQRFGRLVVLQRSVKNLNKKAYWVCRCDCGNLTTAYTGQLNSKQKQSCGCIVIELCKARKGCATSHGHASNGKTSPTYQSWRAMHQRCECPKNKDYKNYGERGIYVIEDWKMFETFLLDMGERPSKDYSLDRINPDDIYKPSNCQWILKTENSRKGNAERSRIRKEVGQ